jgi:hypothetical protein
MASPGERRRQLKLSMQWNHGRLREMLQSEDAYTMDEKKDAMSFLMRHPIESTHVYFNSNGDRHHDHYAVTRPLRLFVQYNVPIDRELLTRRRRKRSPHMYQDWVDSYDTIIAICSVRGRVGERSRLRRLQPGMLRRIVELLNLSLM